MQLIQNSMEKQRYQIPELEVIEIQMENSTLTTTSPGGENGGGTNFGGEDD